MGRVCPREKTAGMLRFAEVRHPKAITETRLVIQLRRAENLEVASGQFPYEEFKTEMLAYIDDALIDLDLDEVQGQPSVLKGFPSGKVYDEEVEEDEEIEEDEEDEMTIDKVIALPEPEEEER